MKLLLVEDNRQLGSSILQHLEEEGYLCTWADDYQSAYYRLGVYSYDLVVLDLNLPDGNGLKLLDPIRAHQTEAGVLIISARNSLDDKVQGLREGADDYLTKPFHLAELSARLQALARRRHFGNHHELHWGDLRVDTRSLQVWYADEPVALTRKEYELLLYFLSNPNRVLSKESIAEHLWGDHIDTADSFDFIYTHIRNLRRKLSSAQGSLPIRSVYGMGYQLQQP